MAFEIEIGPVVLITNNDTRLLIRFLKDKNDVMYIQLEQIDVNNGTTIILTKPIPFQTLVDSGAIQTLTIDGIKENTGFRFHDQETGEICNLFWNSVQKKFYLNRLATFEKSSNRRGSPMLTIVDDLFEIGSFGIRTKIKDNIELKKNLGLIVSGEEIRSECIEMRRLFRLGEKHMCTIRGSYWVYIGRLRSISRNAAQMFQTAMSQRLDEPLDFNKITKFLFNKLKLIKNTTLSRKEYYNALRYLQTSDIRFLADVNLNAQSAITNLYASYGDLKLDSKLSEKVHAAFLKGLELEEEKYKSKGLSRMQSSKRLMQNSPDITVATPLTNETVERGRANIVEYMTAKFRKQLSSYERGHDKTLLIATLAKLEAVIENPQIWDYLPSPVRAQLYVAVKLAFKELKKDIKDGTTLSELSKQFPLKNDEVWLENVGRVLDKLKTALTNHILHPEDEKQNVIFIESFKEHISKLKDGDSEIIWSVIFNEPYLRKHFLSSQDDVREKVKQYPSVASSLIKDRELRRDYYPDNMLIQLFEVALQTGHQDTARALYENEGEFLSSYHTVDGVKQKYTRGERLASLYPSLANQMIRDNSKLINKKHINRLFDYIWRATDNPTQDPIVRELFFSIYLSDHWKYKNKGIFLLAKKEFLTNKKSKMTWIFSSVFRSGSSDNTARNEDDGGMQQRLFKR